MSSRGLVSAALLFAAAQAGGEERKARLLTFRFLSGLGYVHGVTPVPEKLLALEGEYVKIRGYMAPIGATKDMDEFVLIPIPLACCFKEAPPVDQQVWVKLKKPLKADFVEQMITLKGVLHIEEKTDGGVLKSLTHLEADFLDTQGS